MIEEVNEAEFAASVGIDWSDEKHDICLLESGSRKAEYQQIQHTPEALSQWIARLRARFAAGKVAVCLEQSRGALINALMNHEFLVLYPINPNTLSRYREAFATSKAKDDPTDAYLLMELVTKHRDKLRAWHPDDEQTRSIMLLGEARRKAVHLRTLLTNKLIAALKGYFPQAIELVGTETYSVMACDFLLNWPTLEDVQKADKQALRKFYYGHTVRRGNLIEKRLEIIEKALPVTTDKAIINCSVMTVNMLAKQLRTLADSIREYDKKIQQLFSSHPDSPIFSSLPGAGAAYAPRLLAAFGTNRSRYESADEIQKYSGIAPVLERSGKTQWVHRRFACPKFLRQSFHEFANQSIRFSLWARAYYEQQRAKGNGHHAAIRSLAFKWIRIIFRCWKNRTPYDELKYLKALQRKGSSLLRYIAESTPVAGASS